MHNSYLSFFIRGQLRFISFRLNPHLCDKGLIYMRDMLLAPPLTHLWAVEEVKGEQTHRWILNERLNKSAEEYSSFVYEALSQQTSVSVCFTHSTQYKHHQQHQQRLADPFQSPVCCLQ